MNHVFCPNCRVITPLWTRCAYCDAPLDSFLVDLERPAASMDPQLHRLIERVRGQGILKLATGSTKKNETAVIAKVTDVEAFDALDQVRVKTIIQPTDDDKTFIITARLPVEVVELARHQPFVKSLKASQRLRQWLEKTVEQTSVATGQDTGVAVAKRAAESLADGGAGVIVGIVDFGMDFMHRNFRNDDGTSRILAIWDQKAPVEPPNAHSPGRYGYGREYKKKVIDAAIEEAKIAGDPEAAYEKLGYAPPKDTMLQTGAHGTYVADVAAGNGFGTNAQGLAPKADIVFVDVSTYPGPQGLGVTFGDSAQLLEAIDYIFDFAGDRPCVINVSLGTNGGPHDGSSLVEVAIDRLVKKAPNRAVVVAAGNSYDEEIHATGVVPQGGYVDLKWRIPKNDPTSNELEIWYSGQDEFTVEVFDPQTKDLIAVIPPGTRWELAVNSQGILSVINRLKDPNNGDNLINVFFERGLPTGIWTLRLNGDKVTDGRFHAWIERDEGGQARFVKSSEDSYKIDNQCTLSSLASGKEAIVVGSYNAHKKQLPLSPNTSSGPTRDDEERLDHQKKPDICAPGETVLAAHSGTLFLRHRQSGTSMAAPVVTGVIALMLAEAQNGKSPPPLHLAADTIRKVLIETARDELPNRKYWDPRRGHGKVSIHAVSKVAELRKQAR